MRYLVELAIAYGRRLFEIVFGNGRSILGKTCDLRVVGGAKGRRG